MTDYEKRYLEERAAVRAYTEAFRARQLNDLRTGPDGLILDDWALGIGPYRS